MLLRRIIILFSLLIFSFTGYAGERYVKGQILVQLQPDVSAQWLVTKLHSITTYEISINKQVSRCWNIWLLNVKEGEEKMLLQQLSYIKEVKAAQLNHYFSMRNNIPNDTRYNEQWNMNNSGQGGGVLGADIRAERAWDFTTGGITAHGDTIVIAVIDEGMDLNHQDLRLWKNHAEIPNNNIDDDANGYIDDYDGWNAATQSGTITIDDHGTHVAGIAGAAGNNSQGVAGVNWNVQIMPLQVRDFTDAEVAAAYSYVFEQRRAYNISNGAEGAFVVAANSSFGEDFADPDDYPLWCGMYDSLGSVGILSAGATVNSSANIDVRGDVPTGCVSPHLITVTNTTRLDMLANAGFGLTTIDLGAPGTGILSCKNNNTYGNMSGTSMATPHVAGAVALMFAAGCDSFLQSYKNNPAQVALHIKEALLNGVDKIGALDGKTVSGGRLNVFRSILFLLNRYCSDCTIDIEATSENITCKNAADGKIIINITNGTAPYIYDWSAGQATGSSSGSLSPGNYTINVRDANGCYGSVTKNITEPTVLDVVVHVTNTTIGTANGAALAVVSGGTPPYEIQWSNADSTTGDFVNELEWGQYSVTVTDSNGCAAAKTFYVYSVSSVEENRFGKILIYPNPVKHYFYIEPEINRNKEVQLALSDITGKTILSEKINFMHTHTITVQQFPPGIYLLRLRSENFNIVRKIVIE